RRALVAGRGVHGGDRRGDRRIEGCSNEIGGGRPTRVEVGVCVDRRYRQRFRYRRTLLTTHASTLIGAHSGPVSASFGSSLANNGVGFSSGRPTSIGTDSQRACSTV